jgi:Putative prokaryotic signal transducing protein
VLGRGQIAVAYDPVRIMAMKSADLVVVSTFASSADAQIAKAVLDRAGIQSMTRADNAGGMYPGLGGVELLVRAEDAQKAAAALRRRS